MLKSRFPYLEYMENGAGDRWYNVPADKLVETCAALKNELRFDCLSCLTGSDRGLGNFEVTYHLFSYEKKEAVTLKVVIPPDPPLENGGIMRVSSVSHIWASANWMEREAFDLVGINFEGHPDLRRILLPEDWKGNPLRKDYKEEAEYNGMTTTR